jgi:transcriptional regulator with XRE-family HTH domain
LNPVDPNASAAAALGAAIRALRIERGWTLEVLGRKINYTPQHVSAAEHAKGSFSRAFIAACDRVLKADGRLLAMLPAVVRERAYELADRTIARRSAATVDEDVKRRAFMGLGLAVVLLGPEAAARASADDWERIMQAWSCEITTASDRNALLPGLLADLKRLSANGGPQRAIAQLSSHAAMIAVSNGEPAIAARWWHRAQAAANASGDTHLAASVMGLHAVEGVFGLHAPAQVLDLANDALAITDAPCVGHMHALGARVRALGLQGRKRETRDALTALEAAFERLPPDITREKIAVDGWAEEDLHNVASFANAFADVGNGEAAREQALRLYSAALWRGPTQVRLHRAVVETDAHLALDALAPLTEAQRKDRFVRLIGLRALASCESRGADVAQLREALA